jgi:hypothetical protein
MLRYGIDKDESKITAKDEMKAMKDAANCMKLFSNIRSDKQSGAPQAKPSPKSL